MINNNPNLTTHPTVQSRDIQTKALSSRASFPTIASALPMSSLMQNIVQLLQLLVQQLQSQTSQQKPLNEQKQQNQQQNTASDKDTQAKRSNQNVLRGTANDDRLQGTRAEDRIFGLAGNDRIYGRQNNDTLLGGKGDDNLYGGKGDDILRGGRGNDYLSGGRGDNKLFGGLGDDTLYSRLGSDILDGGRGTDTARIRASIDEYSIAFVAKNTPIDNEELGRPVTTNTDRFILTHKETGQTIETTNIEKFRFDDVRLSADELKQRVTIAPPNRNDQLVELSAQQKQNILNLFDPRPDANAGVRVIDKDASGNISVGDIAVVATGDASSVSQQFKTLSAEDVAAIEDGSGAQQARQELESNRQKWNETRPDNYSFTLQRSGFLFGDVTQPVNLTINGNTITNAQFADGTAGEVPDINQLTVDDLFNTIENALNNNAAEVNVTYNDATGLPESIFIDQSRLIADEEVFLSTSNFSAL